MIRLVSETPAVEVAWAAYDRAMLQLSAMYASGMQPDPASRMTMAFETAAAWATFRNLFLAPPEPAVPPAQELADMTIEHGVPLPPVQRGGKHKGYPFARMAVGDSFHCIGPASSVEASASQYGRRSGRRFSARYTATGVRIWRIA